MTDRDDLIDDVARALRAPVPPTAGGRERILRAVAELPPPRRESGRWRWLTRGHQLTVTPMAALATAAGIAGIVALALASSRGATSAPAPLAAGPAPATEPAVVPSAGAAYSAAAHGAPVAVRTQFVLVAAQAKRVALVGDFNDWNPEAMPLRRESTGGLWSAVVPVMPGRHRYAFVVDGERWVADPAAPLAPDGDFGAATSVIVIGGGRP